MNGRVVAGGLVATAAALGGLLYYTLTYAYYTEVTLGPNLVMRLAPINGGTPEPIVARNFKGIDATSSPLRFRACFTTPATLESLKQTYAVDGAAEPLLAPGWFDCFNAKTISQDLKSGKATAFLSEPDIAPGVDRVIAVYPDGHAYAWHQLQDPNADTAPEE